MTGRLVRSTHAVVASETCVSRDAFMVKLRRQPTGWPVASVARSGHHQVTRRHARSTLAVVAGLALACFYTLVVIGVAQAAPTGLADLCGGLDATHIGADQGATHGRFNHGSKASSVGVAFGARTSAVARRGAVMPTRSLRKRCIRPHTLHAVFMALGARHARRLFICMTGGAQFGGSKRRHTGMTCVAVEGGR